jgi:hypothetical protein
MNGMALSYCHFGAERTRGLNQTACCLYNNDESVTPRRVTMKRPRAMCLV